MSEENKNLQKLKIALQIKDNSKDDLLNLYLDDAENFLRLRLSLGDGDAMPDSMLAIIRGAAVKKYNRFSNEGMSSYSQDGESITFSASDFDEWSDEIAQWREQNDKNVKATKGWCYNPNAL